MVYRELWKIYDASSVYFRALASLFVCGVCVCVMRTNNAFLRAAVFVLCGTMHYSICTLHVTSPGEQRNVVAHWVNPKMYAGGDPITSGRRVEFIERHFLMVVNVTALRLVCFAERHKTKRLPHIYWVRRH